MSIQTVLQSQAYLLFYIRETKSDSFKTKTLPTVAAEKMTRDKNKLDDTHWQKNSSKQLYPSPPSTELSMDEDLGESVQLSELKTVRTSVLENANKQVDITNNKSEFSREKSRKKKRKHSKADHFSTDDSDLPWSKSKSSMVNSNGSETKNDSVDIKLSDERF